MSYRFVFFLIILSLLLAYTLLRASHFTGRSRWIARVSGLLVATLAVSSQVAFRMQWVALESAAGHALAWSGGVALGLWGTFLLLNLITDIFVLIGWGTERVLSPATFKQGRARREFLRRAIPGTLAGLSVGIAGLGLKQALEGPRVKHVEVPIDGLPPELDGFRIAQISDMHIGGTIGRDYVEDVVTTVQSLGADVIAVTGDLADGTPPLLKERIEPLAALKANLGVFYITGNHEYYWGAEDWLRTGHELGMTPLINENRILEYRGKKILLAGVTDTSGGQFFPSHACDPARAGQTGASGISLRILLAHRPDTCLLPAAERFQLQLSGHTHAGQFFPWTLLMPFAHRYYKGLNRHGSSWVYVNSGTGYWGTPHRFTVPAEITHIRLVRAST
jgi:predicted MPP superfamily phosphohydrolase